MVCSPPPSLVSFSLNGDVHYDNMIAALLEIAVYVFTELLAYAFARLFLCVAGSFFVAVVICWFVQDRTAQGAIVVFGVIAGFIFGVIWEVLSRRDLPTGVDRQ